MLKRTIALNLNLNNDPDPQPAAFIDQGMGTTLLLLHGFMGSASCWVPLMEQISDRVHCVALDLMGFGDSVKPAITYTIAQEVAFVRQFVESRQLSPCCIMGHSFGGWVAAAYALAFPQDVTGLILAAPAGIRDDSFCGRYTYLRPILWDTPAIDWLLTLLTPLSGILRQQDTVKQIQTMRRELLAQPAARSFLLDRLRPEDAIDTVETQIHRLAMPTLVISGDRDDTIPLWHSETYAREIPNAKLVILPGANHGLPRDYAPQLATAVMAFLEKSSVPLAEPATDSPSLPDRDIDSPAGMPLD